MFDRTSRIYRSPNQIVKGKTRDWYCHPVNFVIMSLNLPCDCFTPGSTEDRTRRICEFGPGVNHFLDVFFRSPASARKLVAPAFRKQSN